MGTVQVQGVAASGRMPSMEAEPKTLTLEQLKYARVSHGSSLPELKGKLFNSAIFCTCNSTVSLW